MLSSTILTVILEVVVTLCLGLCILLLRVYGVPTHRGFFCNDNSIKYPYQSYSTVPNAVMVAAGIGLPLVTILIFEAIRKFGGKTSTSRANKSKQNANVTGFIVFHKVFCFLLGFAMTFIVTDTAKYLIGSLRPHFLAICQPNMSTVNCSVGYVTNYVCTGSETERIKEARLSFPSGHSSTAAYSMLFLAIYVQSVWIWQGLIFIKAFIQGTAFLLAWLCGLSRIHDYRHRWLDVICGFILGIIFAYFTTMLILDVFQTKESVRTKSNDIEANACDNDKSGSEHATPM